MKKILTILIMLLISVFAVVTFVACDDGKTVNPSNNVQTETGTDKGNDNSSGNSPDGGNGNGNSDNSSSNNNSGSGAPDNGGSAGEENPFDGGRIIELPIIP